MEATKKLYDEDVTRCTFCATVLACKCADGVFYAALDATAFYPEGGGQPADHGALGGVCVTDVHERDGVIWHTLTAPLRVGETVQGDIDWTRRLDLMQQHTGEHIFSGIVHMQHGLDNVGFHIGADAVTVDFNGPLTDDEIAAVERAANWVIWRGEPVEVTWPTRTELSNLTYRSKKELTGNVRIVAAGGADVCACCGTHVRRCSEVGAIKVLSAQNYKGGTRIILVCGMRAWRDYCGKCDSVNAISVLLSAKPAEVAPAVQRLHEEKDALKAENARLETQLCAVWARQAAACGETLMLLCAGTCPDTLRRCCTALCAAWAEKAPAEPEKDAKSAGKIICAAIAPREAAQGAGTAYAIASEGADVREAACALNAACNGRGGGKPGLAQGSVQADTDAVCAFWRARQ
ncbi:MAG: alanyl-tRNA editing protein [Ruthenibacterium sp.]